MSANRQQLQYIANTIEHVTSLINTANLTFIYLLPIYLLAATTAFKVSWGQCFAWQSVSDHPPRLNSLSTGALNGSVVLYF